MNLILIAAISENNVIGIENKVPWDIPEDLRRFTDLTLDHPVIMGRKTYESLPKKFCPLPQRKNIVLSTSLCSGDGIYIARNIDEALELAGGGEVYVMGGERIYEMFLPLAERLEITIVHRDFEGDSFFPEVNWNEWNLINQVDGTHKESMTSYSFLTYLRR